MMFTLTQLSKDFKIGWKNSSENLIDQSSEISRDPRHQGREM